MSIVNPEPDDAVSAGQTLAPSQFVQPAEVGIEKLSLPNFLQKISASAPMQSLFARVPEQRAVTVSGLYGSLTSVVISELFGASARTCLVICDEDAFEKFEHDLTFLTSKSSLLGFTDETSLTLSSLIAGETKLVLTTAFDLRKKLLPRAAIETKQFEVSESAFAGYDKLTRFLSSNGFTRKDFVEAEGDYAVRGSIIDVFSFGGFSPVRIELFGDDVDSIRQFDVTTQLSQEKLFTTKLISNLSLSESAATESLLNYLPPESLIVINSYDALDFGDDEPAMFSATDIQTALAQFTQVRIQLLTNGEIDFGAHSQEKFNSNFKRFAEVLWKETSDEIVFASKSKKEIAELAEFLAQPNTGDENAESSFVSGKLTLKIVDENFYEGFSYAGLSIYTESDVFGKLHSHRSRRKRNYRRISLRELRGMQVGDFIVHEDYGIGVFAGLEKIDVGSGESKSEQECVLIRYDKGDKLYVNIQNIERLSKYSAAEGRTPALTRLGSGKWEQEKARTKKRLKDIARNLITLYAKRKAATGTKFGEDSIWQREFEAAFIFDETPDQETTIEAVKKDMQSKSPMDRLVCGDVGFGKTEVAMRAAFKATESGKQVAVLVPTTILAHQHFNSFKIRFQNFPTRIEVLSRFISRADLKKILTDIESGLVDIVIGTHRLVSKDVKFKDLGLLVVDEEQHFGVESKEKLRENFPNVDTLTLTATPIPRTLQFSLMSARDLSVISTPPKNRQPIETVVHEFDSELIRQAVARELARGGQVFFLHNRVQSISQMYDLLKKMFPKARIGIGHGQLPAKELEQVMLDFVQKELDILVSTTIIESGLDISNANTIIINRADMFGLSDLYQLRGRVGRSNAKAYCYLLTPPLSTLTKEALQRLAAIEEFTELGSGFNVAMRDLDIRGAGNLLGAEQSGFIFSLGFDLYQKILEEAVEELKSTEFQNVFRESERLKSGEGPMDASGASGEVRQKPCEVTFFFNALIPSFYVESASERFVIYERISKTKSKSGLNKLSSELTDRFGKLPDECKDLLRVTELRLLGTSLGLSRIEIGEMRCLFTFPDAAEPHGKAFYDGTRFQTAMQAIQSSEMKKFRAAFRNEKRLKLELSFERSLQTQPALAIETTREMLVLLGASLAEPATL
ncbi:MAG: transcription-repair coupling factor [Rhizobacter sp.]|nr:transcription-repair coupling factor [Chlorobiales bacterium]